MRFLTAILLVFAVSACGSGALAHIHRAQHAGHGHASHDHVLPTQRGHNSCGHAHDRDAIAATDVGTDAIASGTADENDSHCQTCLDLISRVVIAEAPATTITCRSVATFVAALEWQVPAVARSHHIESTGPPCC